MKQLLIDILQFLLLVTAQILVSSFVNFGPSVLICFYPLYILSKSPKTPVSQILISSFILGLLIDFFSNGVLGLNASASVFLAFIQPGLMKLILRSGEMDKQSRPGIYISGVSRYTFYIFTGLLFHHIFLTIVENFGTPFIGDSLTRVLFSVFLNTIIILLIDYGIFYKKN